MTDSTAPTPAQQLIGDFTPGLVSLTDDVLFGDVWARPELSLRDRSLITCAALIASGNTEQLRGHLSRAVDNGVTETELVEAIGHLAFYAGWPRAMSAITVAKRCSSTPSPARERLEGLRAAAHRRGHGAGGHLSPRRRHAAAVRDDLGRARR